MGEQGEVERNKIKELNAAIDRNLVRLTELFEGRVSMEELEEMDTERLNNMIDEKVKMLKEKEEQMKTSERESMKHHKR